jgi:uncharacterized protein (DUF433 family)
MDSANIDNELEEPLAPRWQDYIHTDPNILVGKPVVKGTRLGVTFLLQLLAGGWTEEQVLMSYPTLTPESLRAVFAFAAEATNSQQLRTSSQP